MKKKSIDQSQLGGSCAKPWGYTTNASVVPPAAIFETGDSARKAIALILSCIYPRVKYAT